MNGVLDYVIAGCVVIMVISIIMTGIMMRRLMRMSRMLGVSEGLLIRKGLQSNPPARMHDPPTRGAYFEMVFGPPHEHGGGISCRPVPRPTEAWLRAHRAHSAATAAPSADQNNEPGCR